MAHKVTRIRVEFKDDEVVVIPASQNARGTTFAIGRVTVATAGPGRKDRKMAVAQAVERALEGDRGAGQ